MSTDSLLTQAIFHHDWPDLVRKVRGLRVFASKGPGKIHAKFLIVDDNWSIVSSYNLDPLSQNTNSEIAVKLDSPAFNARLSGEIKSYIGEHAVEYSVDENGAVHGAQDFLPGAPEIKRVEQLFPVASQLRDHI